MSDSYTKPDVSVWMTTYFHEPYVAQAIESILVQKTTYTYEIVISDDCSQDGTWDVVTSYMQKYPDIIRAKRNEVNLGLSENVLSAKMMCRGKYIVNLSGDDYWINENKIQLQADFLETHPDYVGAGTKVEMRYDNTNYASSSYPGKKHLSKDYTKKTFEEGVAFPSHGFMIRNIFIDDDKKEEIIKSYSVSKTIDDIYDPVLYLRYGRLFILPDATSAYRVVLEKKDKHNFNSTSTPIKKAKALMDGYNNFHNLYGNEVNLKKRYASVYNIALLDGIRRFNLKKAKELYGEIPSEYRKPWYKSVGLYSVATIFKIGFVYLKNKIKIRICINKINRENKRKNV